MNLLHVFVSHPRAMQKMKQLRRLKLEEVKVLAEEGIELNAADYQRQVEEREAQRRQEREERLAKEAMMTLEAMEREEQEAAEAAAKAAEAPAVEGEDNMSIKIDIFLSVSYACVFKTSIVVLFWILLDLFYLLAAGSWNMKNWT